MRTVFKYPLPENMKEAGVAGIGEFHLEMPKGGKALYIALQDGHPCLWAEVESSAPVESRLFLLMGTGQRMPTNPLRHVGSYQRGWFVGHVFEPA